MGFRFQKHIRIFKGLTVNLSKSGTSWTVGGRGASINVRGDKVTGNAGIPGTGISYRERLDAPVDEDSTQKRGVSSGWMVVYGIVILVLVLMIVVH